MAAFNAVRNPTMPVQRILESDWKQRFRRRLLAWYGRNARDLPWRATRDPYRIWISEVMLQQTQVETVKPYYQRFLKVLPNLRALAACRERKVLKLWEGLGYYRRARQLREAARIIVSEHGGRFPNDLTTARQLPGIGRYTAGAILSIAFDRRVPILEANSTRLLSRLIAYRGEVGKAEGQRILWGAAEELLPRRDVGRFNQALMELGSTVCKPQVPSCPRCPARDLCTAHAHGLEASVPRMGAPMRMETIHEAAIVIWRDGRVLLLQCPEGGRWAGLWDFPRYRMEARVGASDKEDANVWLELESRIRQMTGIVVKTEKRIKTIKHGVTRFRITLYCFAATYVSGRPRHELGAPIKWIRPADLKNYPLNTTGRALSEMCAPRADATI